MIWPDFTPYDKTASARDLLARIAGKAAHLKMDVFADLDRVLHVPAPVNPEGVVSQIQNSLTKVDCYAKLEDALAELQKANPKRIAVLGYLGEAIPQVIVSP